MLVKKQGKKKRVETLRRKGAERLCGGFAFLDLLFKRLWYIANVVCIFTIACMLFLTAC